MARYDQGGGCACGLERWCSCASHSQANGRTVEADRKAAGYVKTSDGGWRKDRSDPEGGIPGRTTLRQYTESVMRADPRARGRAARKNHEQAKTAARQAEIKQRALIEAAVVGLSPRAKKVWQRIKQGQWYTEPTLSINELVDAGLVHLQGRVAVSRAAYVPIGTTPLVHECFPENLP